MRTLNIAQFAPTTAVGDGVTGGLFFIRKLLRQLGHAVTLYAGDIPPALAHEIRPARELAAAAPDVLLVHHSMGHDREASIDRCPAPKVLIYHNITPSDWFPPTAPERHYARRGREQLARWRDRCIGAIGMSPYNCAELIALGYRRVVALPLLIDRERFARVPPVPPPTWPWPVVPAPRALLVLSVGRLVENKRQHLLLRALWHLRRLLPDAEPRLALLGGVASATYLDRLRADCARLGLTAQVFLPGVKCSDAVLHWVYRQAKVYWTASAHEGFAMPLIEACHHDVPPLAFAHANLPATLGAAGLLLRPQPNDDTEARALAAATAELWQDPALYRQVVAAGQRHLAGYAEEHLRAALGAYLARLPGLGGRA